MRFKVGRHLAPDIAAVEIVKPGMCELFERRGQRFLLQSVPIAGTLPSARKVAAKPGDVLQGLEVFQR